MRRKGRRAGLAVAAATLSAVLGWSAVGGEEGTRAEGAAQEGNRARGARIFIAAGCFQCHTLREAGSKSPFAPDLDRVKPTYRQVIRQVTNGSEDMPAYRGLLRPQRIRDVAAYVAWASRRPPRKR